MSNKNKNLVTKPMAAVIPRDDAFKKSFIFLKDNNNQHVKRIISIQDFQIGLKDPNYPAMGLIIQPHSAPPDTSNKLYNVDGTLHWNGTPIGGGGTGDISSVVAGTGLSGGGTSGDVTLNLDVSELSALGGTPENSDYIVIQDVTDNSTKKVLISNLPGDISSVTAGNGLLGGGTSGDVTLQINDNVVATISGSQFSGNVGITPRLSVTGSVVVGNSSPGLDTHFFVSGSKGDRGTTNGNISVFSGDLVVSGTFYAEKMVIEVDELVTGSLMISGSLIVSQSAEIKEGLVVNSSGECGSENDFRVQTDNFTHGLFVDTCNDRILILSGGAGTSANESNASDANFFVSGTIGSRGTAVRGTATFGGDTVISGGLVVGNSSYPGMTTPNILMDGSGGYSRISTKDNTNTYIQFSDSTGELTSGEISFVNDGVGTAFFIRGSAWFNPARAAKDFRIDGDNRTNVFLVSGSNDQVLILSGGAAESYNESSGSDVALYVSGAVGSSGTSARGTSLFGGDVVTSGTLSSGIGSSEVRGLNVYANVSGDYAAVIDNDNGSSGHGLKVTSDGTGSGTRLFDVEADSTTLLRVRGDGRVGIGKVTSLPSSKLTVSSSNDDSDIAIAHRIQHIGDSDTYIQFENDEVQLSVGGEILLTLKEHSQDIVTIGDGGDVDFQVKTSGDDNTLFIQGSSDRIGIGLNNPSSLVHAKDSSPAIRIQRNAQTENSTIEFAGAADVVGSSISHEAATNDIVFKTFGNGGASLEEMFRLGGYYTQENRLVVFLSGSGIHVGATKPREATDIAFFVSGAMGSRGTSTRGSSVFGGDIIASGTTTLGLGLTMPGAVPMMPSLIVGSNTVSGGTDIGVFFSGSIGQRGATNTFGTTSFGGDVVISGTLHGGSPLKIDGGVEITGTMELKPRLGSVAIVRNPNGPVKLFASSSLKLGSSVGIIDLLDLDDGAAGQFVLTGSGGVSSRSIELNSPGTLFFTGSAGGVRVKGGIRSDGSILPESDNTNDLGAASNRWANIYTGDLHLKNDRGDWTIIEEADYLSVVNNLTGKKYKMVLEPIE